MSYPALMALAEPLEDGFRLAIPGGWHQGRTAYGGLSAALALEAARQVGGADLPPLRSAQVSFVGPVNGAISVHARVLRRGRNATWVQAEVCKGDEVCLSVMFVFMGPVASELRLIPPFHIDCLIPPEAAATRELPPGGPLAFMPFFDVRFAAPLPDKSRPEVVWWMRPKDGEGMDPATVVLLCADLPPPGVFPLLPRPVPPISSMTWLANFLTPAPVTRDGWWLIRTVGDYAENGCSSDTTEIWNADGVPVLRAMQSVAIFG